jgi:hypothetical protein
MDIFELAALRPSFTHSEVAYGWIRDMVGRNLSIERGFHLDDPSEHVRVRVSRQETQHEPVAEVATTQEVVENLTVVQVERTRSGSAISDFNQSPFQEQCSYLIDSFLTAGQVMDKQVMKVAIMESKARM